MILIRVYRSHSFWVFKVPQFSNLEIYKIKVSIYGLWIRYSIEFIFIPIVSRKLNWREGRELKILKREARRNNITQYVVRTYSVYFLIKKYKITLGRWLFNLIRYPFIPTFIISYLITYIALLSMCALYKYSITLGTRGLYISCRRNVFSCRLSFSQWFKIFIRIQTFSSMCVRSNLRIT